MLSEFAQSHASLARHARGMRAFAGVALALCLASPGALAASTAATDGKGVASARLMFRIVIPSVVIVDRDGTVRTNDRHRLQPIAAPAKALRGSDGRTVVALP